MSKADLLTLIESRQASVAIIGLGYVGLPLAVEFARAGFHVTGIEADATRADAVNAGHSYVGDVADADLAGLLAAGSLRATTDYSVLQAMDAVVICVPTPLRKTRDPDISYILSAADQVSRHVHPGMLVVLESTTYPGTTDEILLPRLQNAGLQVGTDVFLAFSPERIDPGNERFGIRNTPKVVGGETPHCTEVATALYACAVDQVVPVSSTRAAEMVKLLENTFRAVNIGLANEVALICSHFNLNVWEVIEAASTKPYGFMPFYPGPGLGGHCLPVDPLYLAWKLKTADYEARFISVADGINRGMPHHVVTRVADALNDDSKPVRGAKVLVLGVAYKRDVGDVRESPALDIIEALCHKGAQVTYHDPHVPRLRIEGRDLESVALSAEGLANADCVVIVADHTAYDWSWIAAQTSLIVDTRNALRGVAAPCNARIVGL